MNMFTVWVLLPFSLLSFYIKSTFGSSWSNGCNRPLGLQDRRVHDSQLSAPSFYEYFYIGNGKSVHTKPEYARLNNRHPWCASGRRNHYIQVDFNQSVVVTGIATQGFSGVNDYYVKTYRVDYSQDGVRWYSGEKVWRGNSDAETIVNNAFNVPIFARYIRVYPVTYNYNICMRMELYGCTNDSVKGTTPAPNYTPITTNFEATTRAASKTTVKTTAHGVSSTAVKAITQGSRSDNKTTNSSVPWSASSGERVDVAERDALHDSVKGTTPAPNYTPITTNFEATTRAASKTTVKTTAHGVSSTAVKAITQGSRSDNKTTNSSVPWSASSGERDALHGKNVSPMKIKAVYIWFIMAAAFLLIFMVPALIFLICRHRRCKRCSSKYHVGGDVMNGIPLTTAVVSMDIRNQEMYCNENSSTTGKYNTDGLTLLTPYAV